MSDFQSFGLPDELLASIEAMGYVAPTEIQQQSIPLALAGRDILGSARTGTGKTGAFGIALVSQLIANPEATALILTPTRELAVQVNVVIRQLVKNLKKFYTVLLIGGDPMAKQFSELRRSPRIVVGTPGRINDHLRRGSLHLDQTHFLVLDEVDRMLDMGFGVQLDEIVEFLPESRQTFMFSATMTPKIEKIAQRYLNKPERITVGCTRSTAENIKQDIVHVKQPQKYGHLKDELSKREGSIIVFVNTKRMADELAERLEREGFETAALHGDLRQRQRDRVIRDFRAQKYRVLIATDVAARGLDIPHIEHVINYDLPQCPEDYIHRIGRTARAGASGSALCIISPTDMRLWKAIQQLLDPAKPVPDSPRYEGNRGGSSSGRKSYGRGNDRNDRRSSGGDRSRSRFSDDRRDDRSDRKRSAPSDRFESRDRPSFGDKPKRDRSDRPSFGDRPQRDRGDRPAFGDRPQRDRGDRPAFGDRPQRDRGDRPAFGAKRSPSRDRSDRPSFGDKPAFGAKRSPSRDRSDRPSFGDKPAFRERRASTPAERRERSFGGNKPSFGGEKRSAPRGGKSFDGARSGGSFKGRGSKRAAA